MIKINFFIAVLLLIVVAAFGVTTDASKLHLVKQNEHSALLGKQLFRGNASGAIGTPGICDEAPPCGKQMACFEGVCAYSNGPKDQCTGNSCGGNGPTGSRYQCVELAQRFMSVKYGIPAMWGENANMMCDHFPAGVKKDSKPHVGGLMVFTWAPFGHVTVVTAVDGDTVHVIEQNNMPTGVNSYGASTAACFLHA